MSNTRDGGPAFPTTMPGLTSSGLTKRELFAGWAMRGLIGDPEARKGAIASGKAEGMSGAEYVASTALEAADALLAELEKNDE